MRRFRGAYHEPGLLKGHPTGRLVGLQIKTGPSWFREPFRAPGHRTARAARQARRVGQEHRPESTACRDRSARPGAARAVLTSHRLAAADWPVLTARAPRCPGAGFGEQERIVPPGPAERRRIVDERLATLAALLDEATSGHLERLGVTAGWYCWEVGAVVR